MILYKEDSTARRYVYDGDMFVFYKDGSFLLDAGDFFSDEFYLKDGWTIKYQDKIKERLLRDFVKVSVYMSDIALEL